MKTHILLVLALTMFLTSCVTKIKIRDVAYQSIRNKDEIFNVKKEISDSAKIFVIYNIGPNGNLSFIIHNLTNKIMTIDQTKSFVVVNGYSHTFYDPTIKTSTITNSSQNTVGTSVSVGAIGSAIGIGGTVGQILNGINVGASTSNGESRSNTTYNIDLPQLNIAPKSSIAPKCSFEIENIGFDYLKRECGYYSFNEEEKREKIINNYQSDYNNFSVSISYSIDEGKTYQSITSEFYVNSTIIIPTENPANPNEALRELMQVKRDWADEPYRVLFFCTPLFEAEIQGIYDSNLYKFQ